ncbi:MAG: biopolymer transporter ExbD [Myxococcota bacterium]
MAIGKPSRVLLHHVPLRSVRARLTGRRRGVNATIVLVPFIDFLIVLVVFLLSTSTKDAISEGADLKLPSGEHVSILDSAPIITVGRREIAVDGFRVADTTTVIETAELPLAEALEARLERSRSIWNQLRPDTQYPGMVVLMVDRSVDYKAVKAVMRRSAELGHPNVQLAARRQSS